MAVWRIPIIIYGYMDQPFETLAEAIYETKHDLSVIHGTVNVRLDDAVFSIKEGNIDLYDLPKTPLEDAE